MKSLPPGLQHGSQRQWSLLPPSTLDPSLHQAWHHPGLDAPNSPQRPSHARLAGWAWGRGLVIAFHHFSVPESQTFQLLRQLLLALSHTSCRVEGTRSPAFLPSPVRTHRRVTLPPTTPPPNTSTQSLLTPLPQRLLCSAGPEPPSHSSISTHPRPRLFSLEAKRQA